MPERFQQNVGINQHHNRIKQASGHDTLLLCVGDLNYRSSLSALEDLRRQNSFGQEGGVVLNHTFDIHCTRTSHYNKVDLEPEADYMIACPDLANKAVYLQADYEAPSDHASLIGRFVFE